MFLDISILCYVCISSFQNAKFYYFYYKYSTASQKTLAMQKFFKKVKTARNPTI